jgi:hypothetical protein
MKCQRLGCASMRTSFRHWTALAAILLIAQFFAVTAPLRGQAASRKAPDPFEGLLLSLDVAADEQLAAIRTEQLLGNMIPRATNEARPPSGAPFPSPEGIFSSGRRSSAEQHFQILGVDAGGIFREEGVPVALLRMPQVESNWNPFALSPKGAFGLWQLMPATARRYGLRVDAMRDDRADVEKATHAAARYLRHLHLRFGDWALALAAYNAGEDAVQKAMERGESNDFGNLSREKLLPAETRAYVPAVLATLDQFGTERRPVVAPRSNPKFVASRIAYAAAVQ